MAGLPFDDLVAARLAALGVDDPNDPLMRVLGGQLASREVEATNALIRLANLLAATRETDLADLDPDELTATAERLRAYQRARREVLRRCVPQ